MTTELMSDEEYVEKQGLRCPKCGSDQIEGGAVEIEGRSAFQEVGCLDCDAEWVDVYQLVGYTSFIE